LFGGQQLAKKRAKMILEIRILLLLLDT